MKSHIADNIVNMSKENLLMCYLSLDFTNYIMISDFP